MIIWEAVPLEISAASVKNSSASSSTGHKKMKKMKSIMKLVGKLARILVAIAKSHEPYCSQKVQPFAAIAA